MKKALSLTLALVMCLSLITIPAYAAPRLTKDSAMELKAGQSDTFDNKTGYTDDFYWYKFQLSAVSKVVVTASLNAAPENNDAAIIVFDYSNDVRNEMGSYVVPVGSVADTSYEQAFRIGRHEGGTFLSRTGTYYLDKGWYYLAVGCSLDDGIVGTIKIDSIGPIANTGGVTKASAPTIDPSKEIVKQSRFEGNLVEGAYYYKFTLAEAAEVSIKKSVNPTLKHDDGNPGSVLRLLVEEGNEAIWGVVDGGKVEQLEIRETDANLTKTITYSLSAGTYYVCLNNDRTYPGTEYTLSFTMPGTSTSGTPSSWAVEQVNAAIAAQLVPQSLQSSYTQAATRAEFCALAVALYEKVKGEITERQTFNDTTDINVQKAAAIGVVNGVGNGNFAPNDKLTREQAATMLARLSNAVGKPISESAPTFSDNGSISDWASAAVGQMQSTGIMGGVGDNMFSPKGDYTREQSIVTMLRLNNYVN